MQTCRSYGFYEKTCPLVYTIEGRLVGDGASFVEEVREKFGKVLGMTKETQKKRTHENMTLINEEMRKKQEGVGVGGYGTLGVAPPRKAISNRRCVLHVRCEIVLVVVVVQSAKRAGALLLDHVVLLV